MNTQADLWIDWDHYHLLTEKLADQIYCSGWTFERLICVARGGLRVGDVLSRLFNVPLDIISASSYRESGVSTQSELMISPTISGTHGDLCGKVLLVDDLVDSGKTLKALADFLENKYSNISEIRTAVLWKKGVSMFHPDYFAADLPQNPWIHQPFESYETILPSDLSALWQKKLCK